MALGPGPRFTKKAALTAKALNAVSRRTTGTFSASAGGFSRVGNGGGVGYTPPRQVSREQVILVKITGNEELSDNRWKYSWREQEVDGEDITDKNGRIGDIADSFALNCIEANNSAAGVQGNGVDLDGPIFTDNTDMEIQPVPNDVVVLLNVRVDVSGGKAYIFSYVNAVDGECA